MLKGELWFSLHKDDLTGAGRNYFLMMEVKIHYLLVVGSKGVRLERERDVTGIIFFLSIFGHVPGLMTSGFLTVMLWFSELDDNFSHCIVRTLP